MHARLASGRQIAFTREGVRALDRAAIETLGIPGIILMENAAASIERVVRRMIARHRITDILICCGPGNNGGDGLALARRLHMAGIESRVLLAAPRKRYADDARINLDIVMRLPIEAIILDQRRPERTLRQFSARRSGSRLLVDALFGTGLDRPLRAPFDRVVDWINDECDRGAHVLAVDIPTGLDCDTGEPLGQTTVRANVTVTLAGRKAGFDNRASRRFTGRIVVGDIGVPTALIRRFSKK